MKPKKMKPYQQGEVMIAMMAVMLVAMVGLGRMGMMGMGHGDEHAGPSGDSVQQTTIAPATSAAPKVQ